MHHGMAHFHNREPAVDQNSSRLKFPREQQLPRDIQIALSHLQLNGE